MRTTWKRQPLFALLQVITFVCTTAIENILSTTPIVNFCMPYYNCQHFYKTTTFVRTIAAFTLTSKYYSYWLLNATFYAILELAIFVFTIVIDDFVSNIATEDYCMLQTSIHIISYIDCKYKHKLITAS